MFKKLEPIFFERSFVPKLLSYIAPIKVWAFSFGIFVWCRGEMSEKTKRHETIHFQQQLELFFVFQWILYGFFWLVSYAKTRNGKDAYYNNPFELEAYDNDKKEDYLEVRPRFAWVKYVFGKKNEE